MKKPFILILSLILVLGVGGYFYYKGTSLSSNEPSNAPAEDLAPAANVPVMNEPQEATHTPQAPSGIPSGWLTYTNADYGFEVSYPPSYESMDDAENLYGWPDALVLFYGGGQAYDIVVEHWDSQADLQASNGYAEKVVHDVNGEIISVWDITKEPQNAAILTTFTTL
jgi:hypothetical protein